MTWHLIDWLIPFKTFWCDYCWIVDSNLGVSLRLFFLATESLSSCFLLRLRIDRNFPNLENVRGKHQCFERKVGRRFSRILLVQCGENERLSAWNRKRPGKSSNSAFQGNEGQSSESTRHELHRGARLCSFLSFWCTERSLYHSTRFVLDRKVYCWERSINVCSFRCLVTAFGNPPSTFRPYHLAKLDGNSGGEVLLLPISLRRTANAT